MWSAATRYCSGTTRGTPRKTITAPTLLIWGRHDPVIPLRIARRIERAIPGARLVVLKTGHVPHTTDPHGVAAQLMPFADAAFGREPAKAAA